MRRAISRYMMRREAMNAYYIYIYIYICSHLYPLPARVAAGAHRPPRAPTYRITTDDTAREYTHTSLAYIYTVYIYTHRRTVIQQQYYGGTVYIISSHRQTNPYSRARVDSSAKACGALCTAHPISGPNPSASRSRPACRAEAAARVAHVF